MSPKTFLMLFASAIATISLTEPSLGVDYIVRGYSSNQHEKSEYSLVILEDANIAYIEFATTISSPFGSSNAKTSGSSEFKVKKFDWGQLVTMKPSGVQSYYGSTGSGKNSWTEEFRIEVAKDGWRLILPSKKVIDLYGLSASGEREALLKRAKSSRRN